MNQENQTSPQRENNVNRDAIDEARQRQAEREWEREQRREEDRWRSWEYTYELGGRRGYRDGGDIIIPLVLVGIWLVVSSVIWLVQALRWPAYYTVTTLDVITGARLIPGAPWLVWMVWGGIFGGCLGYWLIAPLYGLKENRALVMAAPAVAMLLAALLTWAFVR